MQKNLNHFEKNMLEEIDVLSGNCSLRCLLLHTLLNTQFVFFGCLSSRIDPTGKRTGGLPLGSSQLAGRAFLKKKEKNLKRKKERKRMKKKKRREKGEKRIPTFAPLGGRGSCRGLKLLTPTAAAARTRGTSSSRHPLAHRRLKSLRCPRINSSTHSAHVCGPPTPRSCRAFGAS